MQKMTGSERQFSNLRWGPPPAQQRSAEALIDIEIWGLGYLWSNDLPLFRLQKMLDKKRTYENRLSTQDVNANPIQNVFMLQIDVSRCV